jgi:putative oxidoreductase
MPIFSTDRAHAFGLLLLRLGAGAFMLVGHGLPKVLTFAEKAAKFADPLHIGSRASFTLAASAEALGAALVALGLFTRPAAASVVVTMLVAGLLQHAHDPFARKELALLYAVAFAAVLLTGPGPLSLDAWIARRRRK